MSGKDHWFYPALLSVLLGVSVGVGCRTSKDESKDVMPVETENGVVAEGAAEEGAGANPEDQSADGPGVSLHSEVRREEAPEVSAADAKKFSDDNRAFAFELYHQLRAERAEQNLFVSPHSISSALAMAYGGARGETAAEMAQAMHFTLSPETLHPAFNALDGQLAGRAKIQVDEGSAAPFQLKVVNAIWGENDYPFSAEYLDLLARNYGAGLHQMDFSGQAEKSRQEINGWVAGQTNNRVKNLLVQGSIDSDTRLVLTNAIYFKAGWRSQFQKDSTADALFHLSDGSSVDVKQMRQMAHFPYAAGADYQAIELPYVGGDVAMIVMLPAVGKFDDFEKSLTGEKFAELAGALVSKNGTITLPKFGFESSYALGDSLEQLGMKQAFTSDADFSGMDGSKDLSISAIVHKTFVGVDEEGTEAAAATAVMMGVTSMPMVDFEMVVDRPFLFVIYDKPTQTALFVGRVVDPG